MRLTHVNMNRSRHIIQLSVFPRPAGVHSGRLASQGGTGFGHAFVNSQIYLRGKEMGYTNVRNLGGFKGWLDAGGGVEKG